MNSSSNRRGAFQLRLRRVMTGCMAVVCLVAIRAAPADDERPAFRRALPPNYFDCKSDSQCTVVQGWCATFAINKAYVGAYDRLPADPKGKASGGCPPGWLPPSPRAVCQQQQCVVESGRPG